MMKDLLYIYYYHRFMKENTKSDEFINWNKWNRLDRMCEKYYK